MVTRRTFRWESWVARPYVKLEISVDCVSVCPCLIAVREVARKGGAAGGDLPVFKIGLFYISAAVLGPDPTEYVTA